MGYSLMVSGRNLTFILVQTGNFWLFVLALMQLIQTTFVLGVLSQRIKEAKELNGQLVNR